MSIQTGTFRAGRRRRVGALLAAVAVVGGWNAPAIGQSAQPAAVVEPGTDLVESQWVAVTLEGLPADEDVRVRQCPRGAKKVAQCKPESTGGLREPKGLVRTSQSGSANLPFVIRAGQVPSIGGKKFRCDHASPCDLVAFELDQSTFKELGFKHAVREKVTFAMSTVSCPQPDPSRRVSGSGGTTPAAAIVEWQAETCRAPLGLNVSYITTNSPNGKKAFVEGLTDSEFAVSGIALLDDEQAALQAAGREAVHVPVTVGSLAFVYNYWEDFNRCDSDPTKERVGDLRLSAENLARIITGRMGSIDDPAIAADNPHLIERTKRLVDGSCQTQTTLHPRQIKPVGRADNSAATYTLTSWLYAVAKDAWEEAGPSYREGPTDVFPAGNAVDLRTGSRAVGQQVRVFDGGQSSTDIPEQFWIGFVDTSVGRQLGLPTVSVKNAGGQYVKPTKESVTAALQAAKIEEDGTVTPKYAASDPSNAYPLLSVSYIISDKGKLTPAQSSQLRAFAAYAISSGQAKAEQRGYAPLSDELAALAAAKAKEIGIDSVDGETPDAAAGGVDAEGDGVPDAAEGGSDAEGSSAGGGAGTIAELTDVMLAAASSGAAGSGRLSSPVEGTLAANQALGPAGGPAGIVRAISVLLGVPVLVFLGIVCLAPTIGSRLLARRLPRPAILSRVWRRRLRWSDA
jgi:ABC-type phosphate transport system substrate-binding protein